MMQSTINSRVLQPMMERFREDGAPHVRLSPDDGLKNAVIIYEAIRHLPGKVLLRGDFDRKGKPLVYFPDRPKKCIGKLTATSPIKARNIDADRQDMAQFLKNIADAVQSLQGCDRKSVAAAAALKNQIRAALESKREFHVTAIREPLRTLSYTYKRIERERIIDNNKALYRQQSTIRDRRVSQFCNMGSETFTRLSEALKPANTSRYDVNALMAVHEMKHLLKEYLKARKVRPQSFVDYLRAAHITQSIQHFAKRWIAISAPPHKLPRIAFDTEAWAKELDTICPLILKAHHRQARVDQSLVEQSLQSRLIYQRPNQADPSAFPPLPTLPELGLPSGAPQSVPKAVVTPIPVLEAAHMTPSVEALHDGRGDESARLGIVPAVAHPPFSFRKGQGGISEMDALLYAGDSELLRDIQRVLQEPLEIPYRPVAFPRGLGIDEDPAVERSTSGTLYRMPKQQAQTSSDLHGVSLTEHDSKLSISDVTAVPATEVDLSAHSNIAGLPILTSAEAFKLHLELSDDGDSDEESSS